MPSTKVTQMVNETLRVEIEAIIHDRLTRHYNFARLLGEAKNATELRLPDHLTLDQIFWHVGSVMYLLVDLSRETGEDLKKIVLMAADTMRDLHNEMRGIGKN